MKPQAYIVHLSSKCSLKVDADELTKIIEGLKSGQLVILRQGIFNPSFFICMEADRDRLDSYYSDLEEIKKSNDQYDRLGIGWKRDEKEFQPLQDIFSDVKLLS